MFIFALIANVTYVGRCMDFSSILFFKTFCSAFSFTHTVILAVIDCSILIRSTEWDKIKANLPWLLDAIVCVGLDLFVSSYSFGLYLTFESLCIRMLHPRPHTTYISDTFISQKNMSMYFIFSTFCLQLLRKFRMFL